MDSADDLAAKLSKLSEAEIDGLCKHVRLMDVFSTFQKWVEMTHGEQEFEFGDPTADRACQLEDFTNFMDSMQGEQWDAFQVLKDIKSDGMMSSAASGKPTPSPETAPTQLEEHQPKSPPPEKPIDSSAAKPTPSPETAPTQLEEQQPKSPPPAQPIASSAAKSSSPTKNPPPASAPEHSEAVAKSVSAAAPPPKATPPPPTTGEDWDRTVLFVWTNNGLFG